MSSELFRFAEEYSERGYSLIPLSGKVPPKGFSWKRYQERRATTSELRSWFGSERKKFNLGIVTGQISGLIVIDCDTSAEARFWFRERPSTPLVAVTARGYHFYYRAPAERITNRQGLLGRKIDLRGDGGYVVAPPSVHPGTGKPYTWCSESPYSLEAVPVFDPRWVRKRPTETCRPAPQAPSKVRCPIAYISHIHAISGEGGHNATYRAAATCRDAGMTPDETLSALLVWNETNAHPPWTEGELLHKVTDVFK